MPQSKILVDTNSYLRLARGIHPLLFQTFGDDDYCLYVLPELNEEFEKSARLQHKFAWANEEDYAQNRKHYPKSGKKQHKEIEQAYDFIWGYITTDVPGPSRVDARYLAHALVMEIAVVTDDQDMLAVAEVFGIKTMRTLDLLKLMMDSGHIGLQKVRELVGYWRYSGDMPAGKNGDASNPLIPRGGYW